MSKRCSINKSKGILVGNKVSHSNRKSKKRFLPNLQVMSFFSEILKKTIKLKLTPGSIRTIEHNDGIDQYIMSTAAKDLTLEATKLRKQMKKASAA